MRVRFTPSAKAQFLSGLQYMGRKDPLAAVKLKARVHKALGRLTRFPASGRHIAEFPELPHRQVIVAPHRFFYRVEGTIIWIVATWHSAQLPADPESPLVDKRPGSRR